MSLFLSTTFMSDGSCLYDALDLCFQNGIKSIEIGSNHSHEKKYDYIDDFKFEYLVHNYFPVPKDSFVINIASSDDFIYQQSINQIKNSINFCSEIGAHLYTFHPGFLTDPLGSNLSNDNFDFQWDDNHLSTSNSLKANDLMYHALDEIIKYAQSKKIVIAIETEGSFNKKDHLLMQKPDEYEKFMKKYSDSDIGFNLNIGHLNLASNAFGFRRSDFVNLIQDYIVALELSHNDGFEDQHLLLQPDGWYWDLINNRRFKNTFKILEFRNTPISEIVKNIQMIQEKNDTLSLS